MQTAIGMYSVGRNVGDNQLCDFMSTVLTYKVPKWEFKIARPLIKFVWEVSNPEDEIRTLLFKSLTASEQDTERTSYSFPGIPRIFQRSVQRTR
jgi:hypothetical protein